MTVGGDIPDAHRPHERCPFRCNEVPSLEFRPLAEEKDSQITFPSCTIKDRETVVAVIVCLLDRRILIGTQAVAKGIEQKNRTLVKIGADRVLLALAPPAHELSLHKEHRRMNLQEVAGGMAHRPSCARCDWKRRSCS
jgi:hypothetical protein